MLSFAVRAFLWWCGWVCVVGVSAAEWPDERLPMESAEARRLIAKYESTPLPALLKEAKAAAAREPDNEELWLLVASMHAESGEYDAALDALRRGLKPGDTEVVLLAMMARIHEERAQLGPGGVRVSGGVRYDPQQMNVDRAEFARGQLRAAAECVARILVRQPRALPYQVKQVEFLLGADETEPARAAARSYTELTPESAELWRWRARAELAAGELSASREAAERALALQADDAAACRVLAEVFRRSGEEDAAKQWAQRARFHTYVPDFLRMPFEPEWAAAVERLSPPEARNEMTDEAMKAWRDAARETIEALLARPDEHATTKLLAAAAYRHDWHGEVEDRIFDELERRRAESELIALFDRGQAACTIGGAAPALARLKTEAVFASMLERLPQDRGMFAMNLPEALALYQRPEAIPVLDEAMRSAMQSARRTGTDIEAMLAGAGTRSFIARCLWALAEFPTPEARQALERAVKEREWAIDASAALYAQSREPRQLAALLKRLKREPKQAEWVAKRFRARGIEDAAKSVEALKPAKRS